MPVHLARMWHETLQQPNPNRSVEVATAKGQWTVSARGLNGSFPVWALRGLPHSRTVALNAATALRIE